MLQAILGALGPVKGIIETFTENADKKRQAVALIAQAEAHLLTQAFEFEKTQLQAKADLIRAEATGQSVLQRNWRPVTMLTFLVLVVLDALGLLAQPLAGEMWTLLQLGLGGYVAGRSVEKVATVMAPAIRDMSLRRKISKKD